MTCIRKTGSFEYTEKTLRDLEAAGLAEIERLGGNPMLVGLFAKLASIYKDIPAAAAKTVAAKDAPAQKEGAA